MRISSRPASSALVLVLGAVLLTGCGGGGENSATAARPSAGSGGGAAVPGVAVDGPADGGDNAKDGAGAAIPGVRALVRTATLSVQVRAIAAAVDAAERRTQAAGGLVAEQRVDLAEDAADGDSVGELTLRVPADRLDGLLRDLKSLGSVLATEGSTSDVTAAVADVASRITSQQRSITRIRDLLAQATTIADIVRIEAELATRESALEALQARQRTLADQTDLATVRLRLVTGAATVDAAGGFLGGLRDGWSALGTATGIVLTILGAVLPFLLVLALVLVPAALGYRRLAAVRRRLPVTPEAG